MQEYQCRCYTDVAILKYRVTIRTYMQHRGGNMNWATVRIPQNLFDKVNGKLTELNATSVSELTRRVLIEYLEKISLKEVPA